MTTILIRDDLCPVFVRPSLQVNHHTNKLSMGEPMDRFIRSVNIMTGGVLVCHDCCAWLFRGWVRVFVWLKKCEVKFLLIAKKITMNIIQLEKREGYLNLAFV